jgi:hypothetical protein
LVIAKEIDRTLAHLNGLRLEASVALDQLFAKTDWPMAKAPTPPPTPKKRRFKHTPETRQKLREAWVRRKQQKQQETDQQAHLMELAERQPV